MFEVRRVVLFSEQLCLCCFQGLSVKGHTFNPQQYLVSTLCGHCHGLLWGTGQQGFQCMRKYTAVIMTSCMHVRLPSYLLLCGVFSCGMFSCGVFSCSVFSCGVFSCGVFSCGVFSCGVFSCGVFSCSMFFCTCIACAQVGCCCVMGSYVVYSYADCVLVWCVLMSIVFLCGVFLSGSHGNYCAKFK